MARRIGAGAVLVGLGLALLGSQIPLTGERTLLAGSLLAIWAGSGLTVLAGLGVGRWLGLLVAGIGLVASIVVAGQANVGDARLAADLFFLADGPDFSWAEVMFGAIAFAGLSALAGVLLLRPIRHVPDTLAMDIRAGFQIEDPPVFVPWGLDEGGVRALLPNGHMVTDGYYVVECSSLGGLRHRLGFHFEPRVGGKLVELEFFRGEPADLQQSYDDFQTRLEATFGPPSKTSRGTWERRMATHRWARGRITVTHLVYDRFGPEEHVRIRA